MSRTRARLGGAGLLLPESGKGPHLLAPQLPGVLDASLMGFL